MEAINPPFYRDLSFREQTAGERVSLYAKQRDNRLSQSMLVMAKKITFDTLSLPKMHFHGRYDCLDPRK